MGSPCSFHQASKYYKDTTMMQDFQDELEHSNNVIDVRAFKIIDRETYCEHWNDFYSKHGAKKRHHSDPSNGTRRNLYFWLIFCCWRRPAAPEDQFRNYHL